MLPGATFIFATGLFLSGCASTASNTAPQCRTGTALTETRLFMGLASPKGPVSRQMFQKFVADEIAPFWPEGFTILAADGYWWNPNKRKTEHEAARVLIRVHGASIADETAIDRIRTHYKKAFAQESVLRVDRPVCADF